MGPNRKKDNKSKLGVHTPDLNSPDLFIIIIVITEMK